MKKLTSVAASGLVLAAWVASSASVAATEQGGAAGRAEDAAGAAVGTVSAPLVNTASAYVSNAAISDMYEIQSSKLAVQKSQSTQVKKFARQMIADHTATTAKLKATLRSANLNLMPPPTPDARRQGMLDDLSSLSGMGFDKAYLDQQTAAHQEALALHSGYARDGDNPALKTLAAGIAPKIQHHLEMVQQLDSSGADSHR